MKIVYSDKNREISVELGVEEAYCLIDRLLNSETIRETLHKVTASEFFTKYVDAVTKSFPVVTPEPTTVEPTEPSIDEHESGGLGDAESILTGEKKDAKEKGKTRSKA